jgi:poly(3-hydroxybutyrate) depolymerase
MNSTLTLLPLHANPNSVTISGWSIGAQMAVEIACIYSSKIQGLGIITGAPYNNDAFHHKELIDE